MVRLLIQLSRRAIRSENEQSLSAGNFGLWNAVMVVTPSDSSINWTKIVFVFWDKVNSSSSSVVSSSELLLGISVGKKNRTREYKIVDWASPRNDKWQKCTELIDDSFTYQSCIKALIHALKCNKISKKTLELKWLRSARLCSHDSHAFVVCFKREPHDASQRCMIFRLS